MDGTTRVVRRGDVEYCCRWSYGGETEVRHFGKNALDEARVTDASRRRAP
jgi:hypothetical protein